MQFSHLSSQRAVYMDLFQIKSCDIRKNESRGTPPTARYSAWFFIVTVCLFPFFRSHSAQSDKVVLPALKHSINTNVADRRKRQQAVQSKTRNKKDTYHFWFCLFCLHCALDCTGCWLIPCHSASSIWGPFFGLHDWVSGVVSASLAMAHLFFSEWFNL